MKRQGTLTLEKRYSAKTDREYQVLVFRFFNGDEILIFDEKAKTKFLQHVIEELGDYNPHQEEDE